MNHNAYRIFDGIKFPIHSRSDVSTTPVYSNRLKGQISKISNERHQSLSSLFLFPRNIQGLFDNTRIRTEQVRNFDICKACNTQFFRLVSKSCCFQTLNQQE